jgi:chromate reductase
MNRVVRLAGISGSLRKGSFNTMLLRAAQELLPEATTIEVLSIGDLPIYNADLDIPARDARPASVNRFRESLARADGVVIASPEYNHSIPGGLKNAIDWASRGEDSPLIGKPVSLMGATPGPVGTARMQLAFLAVFNILRMRQINKFGIFVSHAPQKFDSSGNLTDGEARELLRKHLEAFRATVSADVG